MSDLRARAHRFTEPIRACWAAMAMAASALGFLGKLAVAGAVNAMVFAGVAAFLVAGSLFLLPFAALRRGGEEREREPELVRST